MAMNDDCQVEFHFMTEKKFALENVDRGVEIDSFDHEDRFDMDFGTETYGF